VLSETLFALAFIAAAGVLATSGHGIDVSFPVALAFVVGLALVRGFHFDLGAGYYTLIQVLWVPMVLLVGPYDAPLLVAAAYLLRAIAQTVQRQLPSDRTLMSVADSWFCLAPALVLIAGGYHGQQWSDWPLFVAALAAQLVLDAAVSCARAYACLGIKPNQILREMVEVYRVDILLSPVGLLAAFAARDRPGTALLVLPLVLFFRFFAQEREAHVAATLELSGAYRGTALLLGDVIEDDDEYTGQHTRGVLLLAGMVADELGLD
jgi:HD-GYP domain-containing protein (c-di-GMP phosphodiesterase class II)